MSNIVKHTPGPWELWHTDLVIEPLTGDSICQTYGGMDGKTMYKDYEANAKLIAASPELLEALIEMVNEYEIFSDVPKNYKELEGYSGEENTRNIAIIKAKEAIANATT